MIIRLNNGTREFVDNPERFKDIVRDQMGADALEYLEDMISAAIDEECEACTQHGG